jgi:hypothetical protein
MTTHQPATRRMLAPATAATTALLALLGLLLALAVLPVAPAEAAKDRPFAEFAKTFRGDGTLKEGCANYKYRYKVSPPPEADTWALETFLVDRRGETIASGGILDGADPKRGRETFRFCRENTVPGKFRLRGKFTYKVGFDTFDGWIDPTTFRLR